MSLKKLKKALKIKIVNAKYSLPKNVKRTKNHTILAWYDIDTHRIYLRVPVITKTIMKQNISLEYLVIHELIHATGAKQFLNRFKGKINTHNEELLAYSLTIPIMKYLGYTPTAEDKRQVKTQCNKYLVSGKVNIEYFNNETTKIKKLITSMVKLRNKFPKVTRNMH